MESSKTVLYTKNREADLVNMIAAEVSTRRHSLALRSPLYPLARGRRLLQLPVSLLDPNLCAGACRNSELL